MATTSLVDTRFTSFTRAAPEIPRAKILRRMGGLIYGQHHVALLEILRWRKRYLVNPEFLLSGTQGQMRVIMHLVEVLIGLAVMTSM